MCACQYFLKIMTFALVCTACAGPKFNGKDIKDTGDTGEIGDSDKEKEKGEDSSKIDSQSSGTDTEIKIKDAGPDTEDTQDESTGNETDTGDSDSIESASDSIPEVETDTTDTSETDSESADTSADTGEINTEDGNPDAGETDEPRDTASDIEVDDGVLYGLGSPYVVSIDRITGEMSPLVKVRLEEGDNSLTRLDYHYQHERFYTLLNTADGGDIVAVDTCNGNIIERHPIVLDGQPVTKVEGFVISDDGETVYVGANINPDVGDSEALLSVELDTGVATMVVTQVNSTTHDVDGLGMLPDGTLFVSDYNKEVESEFLTLNVKNSETVQLSTNDSYSDMDYHPSWDILYGVNGVDRTFGTVNQSTGDLKPIATYLETDWLFSGKITGIAAGHRSCSDLKLYAIVGSAFVAVSAADGKATEISQLITQNDSDTFKDLVYDSARQTYHLLRTSPDETYFFDTIDPCSGVIMDGPQIATTGERIVTIGSIQYADSLDTFFITYTHELDTTMQDRLGMLNPTDGIVTAIGELSDGQPCDGDYIAFANDTLYLGDIHLRSGEGEVDDATFYKVDTTDGTLTQLATYTELPCFMIYHPQLDTIFIADCHTREEKEHIPRSISVINLETDTVSTNRIGYYAEPLPESPQIRGLTVAPVLECQ